MMMKEMALSVSQNSEQANIFIQLPVLIYSFEVRCNRQVQLSTR